MKIQDQVVAVIGLARGLGLAIAQAFYRKGAKVVLNCNSYESFIATVDAGEKNDKSEL